MTYSKVERHFGSLGLDVGEEAVLLIGLHLVRQRSGRDGRGEERDQAHPQ